MKGILKIVGVILLVFLGLFVLGWVLRIVGMIFSLAIGLAFIVGIVYLINYLFKLSNKDVPAQKAAFIVMDYTRPAVTLFSKQPTANELLKAQMSTADSLEFAGLDLDNNTEVIVLGEMNQGEAVRVRVKTGMYHGREGWVSSALLHQQKLIGQ